MEVTVNMSAEEFQKFMDWKKERGQIRGGAEAVLDSCIIAYSRTACKPQNLTGLRPR